MKVMVVTGYGQEKRNGITAKKFLNYFKELLMPMDYKLIA